MSRFIRSGADLTARADIPPIFEMASGFPFAASRLGDFYAGEARVWVLGNGEVSQWTGWKGNKASQSAAIGYPAYSATAGGAGKPGLVFSNTGIEILHTPLTPSASGYIGVHFRTPAANASHKCLVGSETNATNRCALFFTNTMRLYARIGACSYQAPDTVLLDAAAMAFSTNYVAGLYWDGGTAAIRLNKVQKASAAFTGGGASVGTDTFSIGGRHTAATPTGLDKFEGGIMRVAFGTGAFTAAELDQIDDALTA